MERYRIVHEKLLEEKERQNVTREETLSIINGEIISIEISSESFTREELFTLLNASIQSRTVDEKTAAKIAVLLIV